MRLALTLSFALGVLAGHAAEETKVAVRGAENGDSKKDGCKLTRMEGNTVRIEDVNYRSTRDRAYQIWAEDDYNQTRVLERPNGKRWIAVKDAAAFAKKTWGLRIYDQTNDPAVGEIKFAIGAGAIDWDLAMPLFVEAMSMAIQGARQDVYVEIEDDHPYFNYDPFVLCSRAKIYIRRGMLDLTRVDCHVCDCKEGAPEVKAIEVRKEPMKSVPGADREAGTKE